MLQQKNDIAKLLNLKEGQTEKDIIEALEKSDLIMEDTLECMYKVGSAAFHFIASNHEDLCTASAMFPLERLFEFYYILARKQKSR